MIRLNPSSKRSAFFKPEGVDIVKHFGDIDVSLPHNTQIENLLWIPAMLVSRFIGQYPFLAREAEDMFSIGMLKVCQIVNLDQFDGAKIGAVCNVSCRRDMEDHCNGLNSVVKVCTTTRYENRKKGISTPRGQSLTELEAVTDDMVELIIRDACQSMGVALSEMSVNQKRELWRSLSV